MKTIALPNVITERTFLDVSNTNIDFFLLMNCTVSVTMCDVVLSFRQTIFLFRYSQIYCLKKAWRFNF